MILPLHSHQSIKNWYLTSEQKLLLVKKQSPNTSNDRQDEPLVLRKKDTGALIGGFVNTFSWLVTRIELILSYEFLTTKLLLVPYT